MKLTELQDLFAPLYIFCGFIFIACLFLCLVRVAEYCDKRQERLNKENDNHIKNIVRKEIKDYDNNVNV